MSHTHLLYHIVFATKDRLPLIRPEWEAELYSYMSGIIKNHDGYSLQINGDAEHVHLLTRLGPKMAISDFMRELKASSSRWVRNGPDSKFSWQRRYGAFSVSESAASAVSDYIKHQKVHHQKQTFDHEYKILLSKHGIEFDEQYLWS